MIGWFWYFNVLQELIYSSRSRFPLWLLLFYLTGRETTAPGQESSLEEAVLSGQQEAPNPQDSVEKPSEVRKLIAEGQHLNKKRQKLIKIADRNKDSWLSVQEYESNDFASDSEDEKKLRKAQKSQPKEKEKRRKATAAMLPRSLSLLVILIFFAVRSFIFLLCEVSRGWIA